MNARIWPASSYRFSRLSWSSVPIIRLWLHSGVKPRLLEEPWPDLLTMWQSRIVVLMKVSTTFWHQNLLPGSMDASWSNLFSCVADSHWTVNRSKQKASSCLRAIPHGLISMSIHREFASKKKIIFRVNFHSWLIATQLSLVCRVTPGPLAAGTT